MCNIREDPKNLLFYWKKCVTLTTFDIKTIINQLIWICSTKIKEYKNAKLISLSISIISFYISDFIKSFCIYVKSSKAFLY